MKTKFVLETNCYDSKRTLMAMINEHDFLNPAMQSAVFSEIAKLIAQHIAHYHWQEIVALIDMQAIANLTVAQGAAEILKTLNEKLPNTVRHHYRDRDRIQLVPFPAEFLRGETG